MMTQGAARATPGQVRVLYKRPRVPRARPLTRRVFRLPSPVPRASRRVPPIVASCSSGEILDRPPNASNRAF
jgi:hypothetical protein